MDTKDTDIMAARIRTARESIRDAARRAGRDPATVTLMAVTKGRSAQAIAAAAALGITDFGENRVQEAEQKLPEVISLGLPAAIRRHLIGHLQTNKVRHALPLFDTIQSVDSVRLASRLDREAPRHGRHVPVLLEVNVAREATKQGFLVEDLPEAALAISHLPNLAIQGLMTVAPVFGNPEMARPVFRALREWQTLLREIVPNAAWRELSMGMSDDYIVAVEEGATIIRLGRAIFGDHPLDPPASAV